MKRSSNSTQGRGRFGTGLRQSKPVRSMLFSNPIWNHPKKLCVKMSMTPTSGEQPFDTFPWEYKTEFAMLQISDKTR